MLAIRIESAGGPEVLQPVDLPTPAPGPGHCLVRVRAAGVNFMDTYQRTGLYKVPLPYVPGVEGAGEVIAGDLPAGTRVAWAAGPGSYAEEVVVPTDKLVPIPAGVPDDVAAAVMLQGMTAHYLSELLVSPKGERTAVVLAASGGTGRLLCQRVKNGWNDVIGVVSSDEKAALVRDAGAKHVLRYEGFAAEVKRLTGGRGADVVYDSVGQATWRESLAALAPRGMLVLFGQSSGPVPPIDPFELSKGSYFLTRPILAHYMATREELLARAGAVLSEVERAWLQVRISHRLPLAQAAEAHRILEGRRSLGKILLVP